MLQCDHLDGCQAMGINSSFICTFWALSFLKLSYHPNLHHARFFFALASQTNQEHISKTVGILQCLHHTFLMSYTYPDQIPISVDAPQQLFHTYRGSYIDPEQIRVRMDPPLRLFHTSLGSYTDHEQITACMDLFQPLVTHFLRLILIQNKFQYLWE